MRGPMTGRAGMAALAAMMLVACTTTTEQGAVGVERRQLLLVSSAEMDQAAAAQYQNVIQQQSPKGNVNRDPKQVERVRGIAKRLIPQTAVFRKDALDWKWEVNVLTSPEVNAWCMPGGKIAVYTGIIEKLEITDDELAAVMARGRASRNRSGQRGRAGQLPASVFAGPRDRGRPHGRRARGASRLRPARGDRSLAEDGKALERRRTAKAPLDPPVARRPHQGSDGVLPEGAPALRRGAREEVAGPVRFSKGHPSHILCALKRESGSPRGEPGAHPQRS